LLLVVDEPADSSFWGRLTDPHNLGRLFTKAGCGWCSAADEADAKKDNSAPLNCHGKASSLW